MPKRVVNEARHAASRLKRRIHQASAPRTPTPAPSTSSDGRAPAESEAERLLHLLFPQPPSAEAVEVVRELAGSSPPDATTVRHILGYLDRQTSPTPFSVRLSPDDVVFVANEGVEVALDRHDQSVSGRVFRQGDWEPHVGHVLRSLLRPGSVFVDIGANVGWHTALASALVGPAGHVMAVEPNPDNARLIAWTIEHNHLANVRLVPLALAGSAGYATFRSAVGSNGGFAPRGAGVTLEPWTTIVPTIAFDEIAPAHVDVVKIDVEGGEPIVFAGAERTIRRDHPAIVFEFNPEMTEVVGGVPAREHLGWFEAHGYRLSLIEQPTGTLCPVDDLDRLLADWPSDRIEDFVATPAASGSTASNTTLT